MWCENGDSLVQPYYNPAIVQHLKALAEARRTAETGGGPGASS
jgi:hypothetical protein